MGRRRGVAGSQGGECMVYKWRTTLAPIETSTANDVGAEFEKIEARKGGIVAEDVIEVARDEDNILHNYFEWDDTVAGHKFRLMQARILIKSIEVVVDENTKDTMPSYVSIKDKRSGTKMYKNIIKVINDEDDYQYTLERARREFLGYKDKYQKILDIKDLKDMILENI